MPMAQDVAAHRVDFVETRKIRASILAPMNATRLIGFMAIVAAPVAAGRDDFRLSLTATVLAPVTHERPTPTQRVLGCQVVRLRWRYRPGATDYVAYSSTTAAGPWLPLPSTTACGPVRRPTTTSALDAEPTRGGATVVTRLFYRVAAMDGARIVDITEVIPVDLTSEPPR